MIKRILALSLVILILSISVSANDGSYYVSGNQLIPIIETDISVRKEILKITRKTKRQVEVSVYYEFFNPGNPKSVIVGFEAFSPGGDVDPRPRDGQHPNIYHFTVNMNDKPLSYKVAIVEDSAYYENGKFKTLTRTQMEESMGNNGWQSADFFYVYHFTADFKTGLNIIKHTYICDLSGSVDFLYSFDYVLTAATRWANKQIDDFTLIVDMGEFQDFHIDDPAFGESPGWTIKGKGVKNREQSHIDYSGHDERELTRTRFAMMKGQVEYHAKNFHPKEELHIRSFQPLAYMPIPFDCKEWLQLAYNLTYVEDYTIETANDLSRRILRNYPFARRGYIFSSPELKKYYSNQTWYKPDPNYKAVVSELPKEEQEWIFRYPE
ncbi:hypothetical protein GGR21_002196 [Dysgonomonas hofstadii]|uniref:YARHG domain-containing protein n=1 Tax=Dysgonomonas hofstadii TaxID=637886 RepID=A0A840CRQ7_9BACT|nr:YARHG domain-containing protein [Dysgonomonas hofstadii]MBB4036294.1 hypothetical protein [Dysgonomonas hofstadii]